MEDADLTIVQIEEEAMIVAIADENSTGSMPLLQTLLTTKGRTEEESQKARVNEQITSEASLCATY